MIKLSSFGCLKTARVARKYSHETRTSMIVPARMGTQKPDLPKWEKPTQMEIKDKKAI